MIYFLLLVSLFLLAISLREFVAARRVVKAATAYREWLIKTPDANKREHGAALYVFKRDSGLK